MAGITAYYDTMTNQFYDVATGLPVAPQDVTQTVPNPNPAYGISPIEKTPFPPPVTTGNMAVWGVIGAFALIMYFANKRR